MAKKRSNTSLTQLWAILGASVAVILFLPSWGCQWD